MLLALMAVFVCSIVYIVIININYLIPCIYFVLSSLRVNCISRRWFLVSISSKLKLKILVLNPQHYRVHKKDNKHDNKILV